MTPVQYLEHEKYIQLKQNIFKMGLHLIEEMRIVFVQFAYRTHNP
jgi:hypothetical protein